MLDEGIGVCIYKQSTAQHSVGVGVCDWLLAFVAFVFLAKGFL